VLHCLLGLVTNTWYLWLVTGGPLVQVTQEIFALNLAVTELWTIFQFSSYTFGLVTAGRPLLQYLIRVER
ncbi:unnamed protein product, partial [Coregonus sp. 'balchen']